jgi:hypothetical protein
MFGQCVWLEMGASNVQVLMQTKQIIPQFFFLSVILKRILSPPSCWITILGSLSAATRLRPTGLALLKRQYGMKKVYLNLTNKRFFKFIDVLCLLKALIFFTGRIKPNAGKAD